MSNVHSSGDDLTEQEPVSIKTVVRRFVPRSWLATRQVFLRLGPSAGRIYLGLRLRDSIGMRASNTKMVPTGARSFLFICFGNIMRSPMAECMLKRALAERSTDGIEVESAGIHANPGTPAHPRAQVAANELGLPLDDHFSRLLTPAMVDRADVIFAMDFQNKAELLVLFPQAKHKIFMLSAYADPPQRYREIPDPYLGDQDEARRCYRVLQVCINNLVTTLWPAQASTQLMTAATLESRS
jgi:protein-tyrosine-phosphatase